MDVNNSIYVEGQSKEPHKWEEATAWLEKYDHPLWKKYGNDAAGAATVEWIGLSSTLSSRQRNKKQLLHRMFMTP
jgi:hypothetical protein